MSIERKVLGKPFADNALFVSVNSGQTISRLLFDCGEDTCSVLSVSTVQKIDHLFISHFHLDHLAGLDHFIRMNYNRYDKPVHIWGPETAGDVLFHRLNSFTWNLIETLPTRWFIHEVSPQKIVTTELRASEAFARKHVQQSRVFSPVILQTADFTVSVIFLNHRIPVLGFKVCEKPRLNVDTRALQSHGLPAGPYLNRLKDDRIADEERLQIGGQLFTVGKLRKILLKKRKGSCLAYLTDFIFEADRLKEWTAFLHNCDDLICESQYLEKDLDLAQQNFHLTARQAAQIARAAGVKQLTLIHFSRRYGLEDLPQFLNEARSVYKATVLPEMWQQNLMEERTGR